MKELDFDELDRAVNSLMTNVPKSEPPKPDDNVRTVTIQTSESEEVNPLSPEVQPETSVTPSPAETARDRSSSPLVASRKSGRFMDVVHQSSDMKKPSAPRHGKTIEPRASVEPAQPVVNEPIVTPESPGPIEEPEPETTPEEVSTFESSTSEWPDPIDMHSKSEDETEQGDIAEDTGIPDAPESYSDTDDKTEQPPLETPFLTDAKVEKRPLGGPAVDISEPIVTPDPDMAIPSGESTSGSNFDDPTDVMPPELSSDVVAVEAGSVIDVRTEPAQPSSPAPAPETVAVSQSKSDPETDRPRSEAVKTSTSSSAASSSRPASINQQYKPEPSTSDQSNGSIYDTNTYHQPLAHPVKKQSSWMWLVWIVLILILGVASGVGVYYLGLI